MIRGVMAAIAPFWCTRCYRMLKAVSAFAEMVKMNEEIAWGNQRRRINCSSKKSEDGHNSVQLGIEKIACSKMSGAGSNGPHKRKVVWFVILGRFSWNLCRLGQLLRNCRHTRCTELSCSWSVSCPDTFSPLRGEVYMLPCSKASASGTPACITQVDAILFVLASSKLA
jgi:hypothetical protein